MKMQKKKKEKRKKRESNEWILDEKPQSEDYKKNIKERKRQLELINTQPLKLKPYYKKEVNKYFNSISKE